MFIQTHRLIGKIICRTLSENNGIVLNEEAFKYGCIKPDIVPQLFNISHEKKDSFEMICKKINRLQNMPMPQNKRELKKYSVELGVIIHFITDYFCSAHNNSEFRKMPQHFIYENRLSKEFPKTVKNEYFTIMWGMTYSNISSSSIDTIKYIEELHKEYIEYNREISIDIRYSLEACMVTASSIISHSLNNGIMVA